MTLTLKKEVEQVLKKAIIISTVNSKARIGLLPDDCHESSSCKGCGMCGNNNSKHELIELEVEIFGEIKSGDIVEVEVSSPRGSLIAMAIYILPLFLMFLGGYIGNTYAQNTGLVIGGAIGFSSALLLVYLLNKSILRVKAEIISII